MALGVVVNGVDSANTVELVLTPGFSLKANPVRLGDTVVMTGDYLGEEKGSITLTPTLAGGEEIKILV